MQRLRIIWPAVLVLIGWLLTAQGLAYEVETHQAVTLRTARRSINLQHFLTDVGPLLLQAMPYSQTFPNAVRAAFPNMKS